ncbi:MAG: hypothetical protein NTV38_11550, partial [Chloroflexi bacterium]|nr:hypothetical protein [Chloroflexota bacterium]
TGMFDKRASEETQHSADDILAHGETEGAIRPWTIATTIMCMAQKNEPAKINTSPVLTWKLPPVSSSCVTNPAC